MIKKIVAFAILLVLIQSKLSIIHPKKLADVLGDDISYSLANYGNTPYGQTFIGNIAVSTPIDGCSDVSSKYTPQSEEGEGRGNFLSQQTSLVYLIERGGCSFITKSRNAEDANGKVVMIFNSKPNEGVNDIILMDQADHSGKGLRAATIFVTKKTGESIADYLSANPEDVVKIKIEFKRPIGKEKNKIKLWMSAMDLSSYEFLVNFYKHLQDLKSENIELDFTPHYITHQDKDATKQKEHCISKGKYCTPEYPVGSSDMYTREVLLEDLRQIQMYKMDPAYWWRYIHVFKGMCVEKQVRKIEECSEQVQATIGSTTKQMKDIKKGVSESFDPPASTDDQYAVHDNTDFELEQKKQYSQSANILPTFIFNGEHFRGDATQDSAIYEFICSSFDITPESCFDSYKEWIEFKNKQIVKVSSSTSNFTIIVLIVISIFVLMFMILFLYRRMIRKEMADSIGVQVNSAISNYYALNDTQSSKSKK